VALGNAYPAVSLDSRGDPVDSGVVIQFTDDTDQPGTGSGSTPLSNVLNLVGPTINTFANGGVYGTGDFTGASGAAGVQLAYPPLVIGADSDVIVMNQAVANFSGTGLTGAGLTDLQVIAYVTDQLGTNVAQWSNVVTGTPSMGSLTLQNIPSGNHWGLTTGADLTHPGNSVTLHSTAGGIFTIILQAFVTLD
jgi:hypothetical protein